MPTWQGWLLLLGISLLVLLAGTRMAMPFLALSQPVNGRYLVVEGWMADFGLAEALQIQKERGYEKIITTGTAVEKGRHFSSAGSYAEVAGRTLVALGLDPGKLVVLPSPKVERDRTYTTALAVARWLRENHSDASVDLLSIGPHSRRSLIIYRMALGDRNQAGVISIPSEEYDPAHWWKSSAGFRETAAEAIAYLYARFIFRGDSSDAASGVTTAVAMTNTPPVRP